MKKTIFLLTLFLVALCQRGFSQSFVCGDYSNDSCYGCDDPFLKSNDTNPNYFPYGGVFTPKGDIRALIVFASFGGIFDTMSLGDWPANSNFPNWAINSNAKAFYTDTTEFWANNIYGDTNMNSVSNYYYQMSKGGFRLMADYYPQKIVVPDSIQFNSWAEINAYVLSQIPSAYNWSKYDNRKNNPKYKYDNSISQPDSVIDYIIFCYRYSSKWTTKPIYNAGSSDAQSGIGIAVATQNPSYRVKHGFTYKSGSLNPIDLFVHELGHTLYNAPHYNGGNGVAGKYFYMPSTGWGMMTPKIFTCPLSWERWLLGWSEITASGINSDISSPADLAIQDTFILRDYITTGDAIRIKIPNGSGDEQHLWIENHQGKSVFDADSYNGQFCYSPITNKKGIGMYVEAIESERLSSHSWNRPCNRIRYIHADGNYNFVFNKTPIYPRAGFCNNPTYNMHKNSPNPIGGQNVGEYIRHDFNNDGKIEYGWSDCNATYNENTPVIVMAGDSTADYMFGKGLLFDVGAKINRSTNPTIINIPEYNLSEKKVEAFYLNGVSVEVLRKYSNGDISVKIRLDDVDISKSTTYSAANIVLSNITNDSNPDLRILPNTTLTICKSATPNRHFLPSNSQISYNSYLDSFVAPTVFTCDSFSFFKQEPNSTVEVKDNSTLILSAFSTYEIGDGAKLIIDSAATIWLKSRSVLRVKGTGRVEIRKGAYICVAQSHFGEQYIPGATIDLEDSLSSLCLRNGYNIGPNPNNEIQSISNCSSYLTARTIGHGKVRTYNDTAFIQDTIFYGKHYISGKEIRAGHHITNLKPHGNVVIKQGAHVIFDAEKETLIDDGTEVELNGKLEVRK